MNQYSAATLATAVAEAVVRDRFEGGGAGILFRSEIEKLGVAELSAVLHLSLIDLRTDGCFQLSVSTDIASAKGWDASRELAQQIHDHTTLDGFLYRSRLKGVECIAIFDRVVPPQVDVGESPEATAGLADALDDFGIQLARSPSRTIAGTVARQGVARRCTIREAQTSW